jgi:hypothetical protein
MLPRSFVLGFIAILMVTSSTAQVQKNTTQPAPCKEPQQKQFDFWVGEWDLTWPGKTQAEVAHGSNSIKRTLDRLRHRGKFLRWRCHAATGDECLKFRCPGR